MRKLAVSLADSLDLRVILSVLYIMTEVLRTHTDEDVRENFAAELSKRCEFNLKLSYGEFF